MANLIQDRNARPSEDDYRSWLERDLGVDAVCIGEDLYRANMERALSHFEKGVFWSSFSGNLRDLNAKYKIERGDDLLSEFNASIFVKPYKSFLNKTYRKNVINNDNWPNAPVSGWVVPENWYCKIGDLIRSSVVVRYLDGVKYLSDSASLMADDLGVQCEHQFEGRMDGYYALHLEIHSEVSLIDRDWNACATSMRMEVQITTEVKRLIKGMLHSFYEADRSSGRGRDDGVWNYESDQFVASNIGHMAHYLEGMLVQLRKKQLKGR